MTNDTTSRRRCLAAAAAGWAACFAPQAGLARAVASRTSTPVRLAAAWAEGDVHRVGVIAAAGGRMQVLHHIDVPTRAHGLLAMNDGPLIATARRPGDWLLRWRPGRRQAGQGDWFWAEPGRSFNGHAVHSADGLRLFTTETDTDTGASLVGVRDAKSLAKLDEWPTHGVDAHALLVQGSTLLMANGGIATRPETGRAKRELHRMDSSLVRLDASSGRLLAQWRLPDRRLSLRHLAVNGPLVGVALQAEHDDDALRATAPVLAVLDDAGLRAVHNPLPLAGYGGDIAAFGTGFAISAPRAGRVATWQPGTGWGAHPMLAEACALAAVGDAMLIGGQPFALCHGSGRSDSLAVGRLRLDNHWCGFEPRQG